MYILLSNEQFNLIEVGNKRKSRQAQSPSLQTDLSTSEVGTSQGTETIIETLSNFGNVDSAMEEESALASGSLNENNIQFWTQGITDKTKREMSELRKEMNDKLERVLKEMKKNRGTQSEPNRRYREKNALQIGTSKNTKSIGGEAHASDAEIQQNEIRDSPSRPSKVKELRTPMQNLNIQSIELNDSVVINEDRTGEDYHLVTGNTKPLHRRSSNNTTTTHNEHLTFEPLNTQQNPVNQIVMAIEKLASRCTQPSLFPPKKHTYIQREIGKE